MTPVVLATLDATDGDAAAQVAVDAKGDVFGARGPTNTNDAETIFEIPAGSSTPVTLASFGSEGGLTSIPDSIGIDAAGDLFVTDVPTGFNSILGIFDALWELPASSSTAATLAVYRGTGLAAVDSAGGAFLIGYAHTSDADQSVFRYDPGTGTTTTLFAGLPVDDDLALAFDRAGNAFATVPDPSGSGAIDVYRQPATGASVELGQIAAADGTVVGLTADAGGDLFATTSSGNIVKVTSGGRFSQVGSLGGSAGTTAGSFIDAPVADAAGDLFSVATDGGTATLVELPAGSTTVTVLGAIPTPDSSGLASLTVNSAGHVYGAVFNDFDVTVFKLADAGKPTSTDASAPSPTIGRAAVPTRVVAGTKVKGTVTVTLDNTGGTAIEGTNTVGLYAVTAGQAATAGVLIGSAKRGGTLAGDRSARVAVAVRPTALPVGSYTLMAVVTDAAGTTSTAAAGPTITVVPATVVLSAGITKVSTTATATGKPLSFTLTVTNDGTVAAGGQASVAAYLSVDGTAETVAVTKVRGVPESPKAEPDKPVSYRVTVTVPTGAAGLDLYPLVVITQDGQTATASATTRVAVG